MFEFGVILESGNNGVKKGTFDHEMSEIIDGFAHNLTRHTFGELFFSKLEGESGVSFTGGLRLNDISPTSVKPARRLSCLSFGSRHSRLLKHRQLPVEKL